MNQVELNAEPTESIYDDPVSRHWGIYHEIESLFEHIFKHDEREAMLHRVNQLRLDCTTWIERTDFLSGHFVAVKENEALLERIKSMATLLADLSTDDEKKMLHDMTHALYRHAKVYRKTHRPIPLCMFTPGTVVEYFVEHVTKGDPQRATVGKLHEPSMGYAIIETIETHMERGWGAFNRLPFPISHTHSFNTAHVTRVVEHKPGTPAYATQSYGARHSLDSKPRNSYKTYGDSMGHLVASLVEQLAIPFDPNQYLDIEALGRAAFLFCGGVKLKDGDWWAQDLVQVPKKKLKRFVKQNMNRFLQSRSAQERLQREADRQQAEFDYTGDFY